MQLRQQTRPEEVFCSKIVAILLHLLEDTTPGIPHLRAVEGLANLIIWGVSGELGGGAPPSKKGVVWPSANRRGGFVLIAEGHSTGRRLVRVPGIELPNSPKYPREGSLGTLLQQIFGCTTKIANTDLIT